MLNLDKNNKMRALLFNLASKNSQMSQIVKQSVRYGGGGPRQFQVQAPKTQGYKKL